MPVHEFDIDARKAVCPDCKKSDGGLIGGSGSSVILDHSTGDLICTQCGLVLEERCIDHGQEWRNFAPEGAQYGQEFNARERGDNFHDDRKDPDSVTGTSMSGTGTVAKSLLNAHRISEQKAEQSAKQVGLRVGSKVRLKSNLAVEAKIQKIDAEAGTCEVILTTGPGSGELEPFRLGDLQDIQQEEQRLNIIIGKVKEAAEKLGIAPQIINRCVGMVQQLHEKNDMPKAVKASWFLALVHLASRELNAMRSIRDLARHGSSISDKTEEECERQIKKRKTEISHALGLQGDEAYQDQTNDEMQREFTRRLQLAPQRTAEICQAAFTMYENASKLENVVTDSQGGSRKALIAAAIFAIIHLLDVTPAPAMIDIANAAQVSEARAEHAYRKTVFPHYSRLLPREFRAIRRDLPKPVSVRR